MKSLRQYLLLLLVVCIGLSVYIPHRYQVPYPRDIRPQFDPYVRKTFIQKLDTEQPEIALLGDSMLGPAVDGNRVTQELNKKTVLFGFPGTASTIWYLIFKNNFMVAEHKPKYIAIFFRDTMMTLPEYRVTGKYFDLVDEFASPKDSDLIKKAYLNQMTPLEKLAEGYFPIYSSRWQIRETIDYYLRYYLSTKFLGCDKDCMENSLDTVFDENNMDILFLGNAIAEADDYLYKGDALDFDKRVSKSFLPEIIQLCKENDVQLILVRMRILRYIGSQPKPPGFDKYFEDLRTYLEKNGVIYLDYAGEEQLTPEYFTDSLHLNEAGKAVFTGMFIEDLKKYLK